MKKKKHQFPWKTIVADLAIVAACVPLILPHLAGAPQWVQSAVAIAGIVIARLNGTTGGTAAGYRPSLPPAGGVVLGLVLVPLLAGSQGCGASWSSNARHGIEVAAIATDVGDGILARRVHDVCGPRVEHLEPGSEERVAATDDCLHEHHFDGAAHAVAIADHALRAAQAAVDAAERAGSSAIWDAAAPQLTRAWCELDVALAEADVYVPRELVLPLAALVAVPGTCRPPVTDADGRTVP